MDYYREEISSHLNKTHRIDAVYGIIIKREYGSCLYSMLLIIIYFPATIAFIWLQLERQTTSLFPSCLHSFPLLPLSYSYILLISPRYHRITLLRSFLGDEFYDRNASGARIVL